MERSIFAQLAKRNRQEVEVFWRDSEIPSKFRNEVCDLIRMVKDWPNSHFLPSDSMDYLLTIDWDDLEINMFVQEIEDRFELPSDHIVSGIEGQTLEEFLSHIYRKQGYYG